MNLRWAGLLLACSLATLAACGQAQDGPEGLPTPPGLQNPVPRESGFPAPTVIPMPPDQPGTMPPGANPTLVDPTVQP